jgi:hypothetical protein
MSELIEGTRANGNSVFRPSLHEHSSTTPDDMIDPILLPQSNKGAISDSDGEVTAPVKNSILAIRVLPSDFSSNLGNYSSNKKAKGKGTH